MKAHGSVFKYGDNVDTDVIIPARYLNSSDPKELAAHCMEDIDKEFVNQVKNSSSIAVTYYPEINRYQGRETLQIVIRNYLTE